jgi:hypothetical protein
VPACCDWNHFTGGKLLKGGRLKTPCVETQVALSGGGGNCTRSPGSAIICPQCGYDIVTEARPEMGREGAALHELVANWHSLTSSVRAMIVDLLPSG